MYYLAWTLRWIRVKCRNCCQDIEMGPNTENTNHQYWKTLHRLIKTKIELDSEHSPQENFNDLRDDIRNMIVKEFKKRYNN